MRCQGALLMTRLGPASGTGPGSAAGDLRISLNTSRARQRAAAPRGVLEAAPMQPYQVAGQNGRPATRSRPSGARVRSGEVGAVCERQAHVIETLAAAVATLRGGAAALKAETPSRAPRAP